MTARIAVYPGSFDPVTLGHIDIMKRALSVVDRLIVAVAHNSQKKSLFDIDVRVRLIEQSVADDRLQVMSFEGLLVDFVRAQKAQIIVRGLRAVSDFEYEFKMAVANSKLDSSIETLFLMASESQQFTSSQIVREIALLGGDVAQFAPESVVKACQEVKL